MIFDGSKHGTFGGDPINHACGCQEHALCTKRVCGLSKMVYKRIFSVSHGLG